MNFDFLKNLFSRLSPDNSKFQPIPYQQKKSETAKIPILKQKPVKKIYQPDDVYLPEIRKMESAVIREIHLSSKEVVKQGFSFQKKSKSVALMVSHP